MQPCKLPFFFVPFSFSAINRRTSLHHYPVPTERERNHKTGVPYKSIFMSVRLRNYIGFACSNECLSDPRIFTVAVSEQTASTGQWFEFCWNTTTLFISEPTVSAFAVQCPLLRGVSDTGWPTKCKTLTAPTIRVADPCSRWAGDFLTIIPMIP